MNSDDTEANRKQPKLFPWAMIATALAEGALSYIGGEALKNVLGRPAYENIPGMIRDAVEELKVFIRDELRKALDEIVIQELEAEARALQVDLNRYSEVPENLKRDYKYLLESSDLSTSRGITHAEPYGISALPIYVSFVSLRIHVIQAFYELDHSRENLRNFAEALRTIQVSVNSLLDNYYLSGLDPQLRLSAVYCGVRHSDGQFPIDYFWCCCDQDGKQDDGICAGSANSTEEVIRPIAEGKRAQRSVALEAERGRIFEGFIKPMKEVTKTWDLIIQEIEND